MRDFYIKEWNLKSNEVGETFRNFKKYSPKSVSVSGVFGGAKVLIECANGPEANFFPMVDKFNSILNIGTGSIRVLDDYVYELAPRVVGGDQTTDLRITLLTEGNL